MAGGVGGLHDLVVIRLLRETRSSFQHDTVLDPQIRQHLAAPVLERQCHRDMIFLRLDHSFELDPIRQHSLHSQHAIRQLFPLLSGQGDSLFRPDSRDMRVCQIGQAQIRPDRLGDVSHHIAGLRLVVRLPRGKDADLGLPLWVDSPIQEPDTRMPTTRIRQDQQPVTGLRRRRIVHPDIELLHRGRYRFA